MNAEEVFDQCVETAKRIQRKRELLAEFLRLSDPAEFLVKMRLEIDSLREQVSKYKPFYDAYYK